MPARPVGMSTSHNGILYFCCVVFLGLLLLVALRVNSGQHSQPQVQAHHQLQRGAIIKMTATGKYYFVSYVDSHGADLVPCIGDGCSAQGWSADKLQNTPHATIYPDDPDLVSAYDAFAQQAPETYPK